MDGFVHNNMVLHQTVDDVLLRLKPGKSTPDLDRLDKAHEIRRELAAIKASRSWRATGPLRRFLTRIRRMGCAQSGGNPIARLLALMPTARPIRRDVPDRGLLGNSRRA